MDVDIDVTETVGVKTGDITGEVTSGEEADGGGKVGAGGAGEEKGAPGCPRVQLKVIVASPPLVVRFRELLPPELHTLLNSFTDAPSNWELDLANM